MKSRIAFENRFEVCPVGLVHVVEGVEIDRDHFRRAFRQQRIYGRTKLDGEREVRQVADQHGIIVLRLKTGDEENIMAYHTSDAGQTWTSEVVPVEPGSLYISRDGRLLTVLHGGTNIMTVLRYTGE